MHIDSHGSNEPQAALTHDAIAAGARLAWEQAGCPGGRDLEFWLQAEQQLRATNDEIEVSSPMEKPAEASHCRMTNIKNTVKSRRNPPMPSALTIKPLR